MKKIQGTYGEAIIYTDIIEESAIEQIKLLCDQSFVEGSNIRIMPDVHAGAGCVIGFTTYVNDKIIPNIVGVDIGCGMLCVTLGKRNIDFVKLDEVIKRYVPSGRQVHEGRLIKFPQLQQLHCIRSLKGTKRLERSIGTLGGGNHFIEIDRDDEGNQYLIIHTGSRNLGKQVAEYYQGLACDLMIGKADLIKQEQTLIKEYKETGKRKEIQAALIALRNSFVGKESKIPPQLSYLYGEYRQQYLDDMKICQDFATLNRNMIASRIVSNLFQEELSSFPTFETIHNYIDMERNIVRKGAVSAQKGEKLLIPINMRDGSLICVGKGNEDWNYSAPHGAGRLYSRSKAKELFTVQEYEDTMKDIFTTSVVEETLDECPMAYKSMADIVDHIHPTVDIQAIIKPIYNYKAKD